jgi:4-amino-4-deoxy-L-arabinose transferase-like glycosyltransferase
VFLLAFSLRLVFWTRLGSSPESLLRPDSVSYLAPADSMLKEGRFLGVDGVADSQRTPGYPLFLAAHRWFSQNPLVPALTQCLLDAGTAVLTAAAAARMVSHPLAWTAGFLYAFDLVAAAHAPLLITESLFSFLLTLCVWRLLRVDGWRQAAAAGAALGVAVLTRPVALYLWLPWTLVLGFFWGRRRWTWAAVFAVAAVLPPGLWCLRNAAIFGAFEFSSMSGMNLYYWEAGATLAAVEGTTFAETCAQLKKRDAIEAPAGEGPFQASRRHRALASKIFADHPAVVLRLHAVAAVKMMAGPGLDLLAEVLWPGRSLPTASVTQAHQLAGSGTRALLKERPVLWVTLAFILALLGATYALAALGARLLWRRSAAAVLVVLVPAAYLLAISNWSFAYYRFRVPMMPLLAVLAAGALLRGRSCAPTGAGQSS